MAANDFLNGTWFRLRGKWIWMGLASDLVNLYGEDLGSNMESDTEVNVSDLFLQYKLQNKCESKRFLLRINFHFLLSIFQSISSHDIDVMSLQNHLQHILPIK